MEFFFNKIFYFLSVKVVKNYKDNQKVIGLAKKVKIQSDKYRSQLKKCQKRLNKKKYIIF